MRNVVRAIIVEDGSLLTIKRIKAGETYWVFPGGGVDDGEEHVNALIRECKEELGVDVEVLELIFKLPFINKEFDEQMEYFYSCNVISGEFGTDIGEEYNPSSKYEGIYEPSRIKLNELANRDVRPAEVKNSLL